MGNGAAHSGECRTKKTVVELAACNWVRQADRRKWEGWYACPIELAVQIKDVPGVRLLRDGTPIVHRSHLPLIEVLPGQSAIPRPVSCLPWSTLQRCDRAGMEPRLYQRQGATFLRSRNGALIADEMRLGKSLAVAMSYEPDEGPLVVVGPLNVRPVWTRLFKLLWPEIEPVILDGREYDASRIHGARLVYMHYDILPTWQSFGWKKIELLVIDEAHVLATTSRSLRLQAVSLLSLLARRVVGVTGTPLWNKPAGLHALLACVSPSAWGRWDVFAGRYASGIRGTFGFRTGEPSNVEEFKSRLAEVMIRRTWDEVRDQLPATRREIKILHLTPAQEREMDFLVNALRDVDATTVGTLARLRRVLGEAKLSYLFEVIAPWFGKPFVIWVWHQDVADRVSDELAARGLSVHKVTGRTSLYKSKKTGEVKREALLDAWRNDPAGILVCNIAVGQVGIDLSHASRAVFAELDFTPATIAQAEMRTFSPEREMEVIYLAAQHRVDEEIVKALSAKFGTSELMGVPAADAAIEVLGSAFGIEDEGDLARLMAAVLEGDE